mmetsp:Transcript_48788/g.136560  ORF Transcript_48788/g.136560 Transcript_48788/m.136560 type:complete len:274 (-) Transcript_48788:213-1034(-)
MRIHGLGRPRQWRRRQHLILVGSQLLFGDLGRNSAIGELGFLQHCLCCARGLFRGLRPGPAQVHVAAELPDACVNVAAGAPDVIQCTPGSPGPAACLQRFGLRGASALRRFPRGVQRNGPGGLAPSGTQERRRGRCPYAVPTAEGSPIDRRGVHGVTRGIHHPPHVDFVQGHALRPHGACDAFRWLALEEAKALVIHSSILRVRRQNLVSRGRGALFPAHVLAVLLGWRALHANVVHDLVGPPLHDVAAIARTRRLLLGHHGAAASNAPRGQR